MKAKPKAVRYPKAPGWWWMTSDATGPQAVELDHVGDVAHLAMVRRAEGQLAVLGLVGDHPENGWLGPVNLEPLPWPEADNDPGPVRPEAGRTHRSRSRFPIAPLETILGAGLAAPDSSSEAVRALRARLGYSQKRLAQEIGISCASIVAYEHGRRKPSRLVADALLRLDERCLALPPPQAERGETVEVEVDTEETSGGKCGVDDGVV